MFHADGPDQRQCSRTCGGRSEQSRQAQLRARKVERPPLARLLRELEESSYVAVGRRYGVSDNAVRKWVRQYRREEEGVEAVPPGG